MASVPWRTQISAASSVNPNRDILVPHKEYGVPCVPTRDPIARADQSLALYVAGWQVRSQVRSLLPIRG